VERRVRLAARARHVDRRAAVLATQREALQDAHQHNSAGAMIPACA